MPESRVTLLESLKDTVAFFKERKTIGRMKTEHSIFIPSSLMINQAEETKDFIKVARKINNTPAWGCPVLVEKRTMVNISGIEFVFQFNPMTNFDAIIHYLEEKVKKG